MSNALAASPALTADHLVVHSAGEGPPIVLLHGLTSSHHEWAGLKMALARDYMCVTWDAQGHGVHQVDSISPSITELARDLATVVARLGPRKPVVVGHSLGAVTILEFLRRFGAATLAGVVLVDQTPRMLTGPDWELGIYSGFTPADNIAFEHRMRRDHAEAYLQLLACGFNAHAHADYEADSIPVQRTRERVRRMHAAHLVALWKSIVHKDYRDDVAALTVPLMVVLGAASNLFDAVRLGRWFCATVPHAQVIRYEGADHRPHLTTPARFARDVAEFASRCTRGVVDRRHARTTILPARPPQHVPIHAAA